LFGKNQNKPREILNQIRDQLAPQLSKKQLNNYKYRNNRKHLGHLSATLQEIIQWCEEKSEPEEPETFFFAFVTRW
jgi:hypothetical protein